MLSAYYTQSIRLWHFLVICISLFITHTSIAAPQNMPKPQTFTAEFWAQRQAQTAFDVIDNIPGFTLVEKQAKRGLSHATANILINGVAPLSKNASLQTQLQQISTDNIQHIDLYQANHPFSAASQFSQLINIVTQKNTKKVTLFTKGAVQSDKAMMDEVSLRIAAPWSGWDHQLNINTQNPRYLSTADIVDKNTNGTVILTADEIYTAQEDNVNVTLSSHLEQQKNRVQLTLNVQRNNLQEETIHDFSALDETRFLTENEQSQLEFGANWQYRGFASWQLHGSGFAKKTKDETRSISSFFKQETNPASAHNSRFEQSKTLTEYATKVAISQPNHRLAPEYGIAISRNALIANTRPSTASDPINILSTVLETRYEPYIQMSTAITPHWQLVTRVNTEYSKLSTQGEQPFEVTELHIKPFARLSFDTNTRLSLSATAQQQVKQLDFDPFISSEESNYNRLLTGNLQLKPMKFDELSLQLNYATSQNNTLNISAFYQWQQNVHEYIPLPNGGTGIGNAGDAEYFGMNTQITLPVDKVLTGGRIELSHTYRHATFNDLITGERPITGLTPHQLEVDFIHETHRLSWGVNYQTRNLYTEFYYDEIYTEHTGPTLNFFTELSLTKDTHFKLTVTALNDEKTVFQQHWFNINRAGTLSDSRTLYDVAKPKITLSMTHSI
ncbi:TonB-dependent receptor plug domain-containing protein [Pseudoalteromonas aurantia]|uniref:TonB-dependent receptor n=1 Tax=Pseudoalteromonas aurantia TaxID=43654 RepID=A0A5S3VA15_9GAMM|nr:hypothetical protein [Pseudoalteromonas aurantia]TMO68582.1 hypothetical protein CWC19_08885 [Pseudoalteromonas aurantia]